MSVRLEMPYQSESPEARMIRSQSCEMEPRDERREDQDLESGETAEFIRKRGQFIRKRGIPLLSSTQRKNRSRGSYTPDPEPPFTAP